MTKTVSLADYKRRQEKIAARAGVRALTLVRPLLGEKLTKSQVRSFASNVFPLVREHREAEANLAREFYFSQRAQFIDDLPELDAPRESYTVSNLVTGLVEFMQPGQEFTSDAEAVATVTRHVKSRARREAVGLSLVDAQSQGWARTSGGTTSCSFCLMLISRGPVYRSRESAGDMKQFHNKCDCVVVPVFDKQVFPGRDEWKNASSVWNSATKGKNGPAALKAFRNAVTSKAPGGQDATRNRAA